VDEGRFEQDLGSYLPDNFNLHFFCYLFLILLFILFIFAKLAGNGALYNASTGILGDPLNRLQVRQKQCLHLGQHTHLLYALSYLGKAMANRGLTSTVVQIKYLEP